MGELTAVPGPQTRESPESSPLEPQPEEQLLIRRLASGDVEALAELYDDRVRAVYSLAVRIVRDGAAAEDVVQDVFVQVCRQARFFDATRGPLSAWLLTITRSRAIDRLRRDRSDVIAERPSNQSDHQTPDRAPGSQATMLDLTDDEIGRVRLALAQLPSAQRAAIELTYFEGLTCREIADRLSEPLGTIKTHIRLGIRSLQDAIANQA